jgi:hypothetical protein
MQEKSAFIGVSDLPLIKDIEIESLMDFEPLTIPDTNYTSSQNNNSSFENVSLDQVNKNQSLNSSNDLNTSFVSLSVYTPYVRTLNFDNNKHDTRVVNEAFQVNKFKFKY